MQVLIIPQVFKERGGGGQYDFFVKLVFKIAVAQQTKTQPPIKARSAATLIFGSIMSNHLTTSKSNIVACWCSIVAIGILNSYMKFHPD